MLTLCMIVRNAEDTIITALGSVMKHVDGAVVVLAGHSSDATEELICRNTGINLQRFYPEDHPEAFFEDGALSDFAAARNYALRFVPEGSHWFYIDADDELVDGAALAQCVEALEAGAGVVALPYDYAHNQYGTPTMQQNKERVYSGRITDWTWTDRVHEWCKTEQDAPYKHLAAPLVNHHREPDSARTARNRRILELMLEEDPHNRRARLHMAECYFASEEWAQALDMYARVHADPEIEPHAYHAALQAAKCALALNDPNAAAQWAMVSVDMRPMFKDGYLLRARVAGDMEDWDSALFWLDEASDKLEHTPDTALSVWTDDYKWNAWSVQFGALMQKRRFPEAVSVAALAMREYPDSGLWTREFNAAQEAERIERSVAALLALTDHFVRRGDTLNAWNLLQDQNLPMTVRQDERIMVLRDRIWSFVAHVFDPEKYASFYTSDVQGHEINGTSIDKYRLQPLVDSLKQRHAKRVLEVGPGAGGPAIWMLKQCPEVEEWVGLDINPDLVDLANRAAEVHGVSDRLTFQCQSLADYTAAHPEILGGMGAMKGHRAGFDAVLLPEIIEHMLPQDAHQLVTDAEQVGESVMMTTPAMFCSDIPSLMTEGFPRDHVKEWSLSDMEQMIFKVPRRRPVNIFKAYAPEVEPEFLFITADGEEKRELTYLYPGAACWIAEFDHTSRHNGPVCIYTGAGPGWSPLDLATKGLGGAETMAMKIAEEFARNNHPVCIYGDWVGVFNGVIYRHHSTFNPAKPYLGVDAWLFISSRIPGVFDEPVNADIKWLWEHDVDPGVDQINDQRLANIDRIVLLSEWHKRHWLEAYPDCPEEKIAVSRNAVDSEDFPDLLHLNGATEKLQRQRHRFVWPSSPDRGLDLVLAWWPHVRKMWPDAELHVFYGFDTIDMMSRLPGRQWLPRFKRHIQELAAGLDGVVLRGRVTQRVLHEEMAMSQFWLYPSTTAFELYARGETAVNSDVPRNWPWNETYCIAAVEAMAMGVSPVVADTGSLRERLEEFGLASGLVPWGSPRKVWLKALKAHDVMPSQMELARRQEIANGLSFNKLYREWMRLLVATSLEDNAAGKHNFAVVSTMS